VGCWVGADLGGAADRGVGGLLGAGVAVGAGLDGGRVGLASTRGAGFGVGVTTGADC
jgi:hypothetical protein